MHARLRPLNALIGLCTPGDLNPAPLHDAGFRIAGLEVPVRTSAGNVVVDVLLAHDATSHLVACESKSGGNVEEDQARRYALLDAGAVRVAGSVTLPTRTPPTVEVLYLGLEPYGERLLRGLSAAGVDFPLLTVGGSTVHLLAPHRATQLLSNAIAPTPIRLPTGVASYVDFDEASTADELRLPLRSQLSALQANKVVVRTVRAIVEGALPRLAVYGPGARKALMTKGTAALRSICGDEPDTFAFQGHTGTHEAQVHILRTPEHNDPRGRTQAWQANGRPRNTQRRARESNPDQLDLLLELEMADDVSGDDDTDTDREARR